MSKNWHDLTLSLAGVFQACALVEQIAKTGALPEAAFQTSIKTLFQMSPQDTESVFGGAANLELGLSVLSDTLHHHKNKDYQDSLRYVLGVLHLQKKLNGNRAMLDIIAKRLKQTEHQLEHFGPDHDNVIANLASIYTDTLSTFRFRIQVMGDFNFLQQSRIANQIRALLFAGIRSAMLWRQNGGQRWHVIFQRKKLSKQADLFLQQIKEQQSPSDSLQ